MKGMLQQTISTDTLKVLRGTVHPTIDRFHTIFSLGNWRSLHHHAPCWLVSIHITWPFFPPVSMVKDAMESVYTLSIGSHFPRVCRWHKMKQKVGIRLSCDSWMTRHIKVRNAVSVCFSHTHNRYLSPYCTHIYQLLDLVTKFWVVLKSGADTM